MKASVIFLVLSLLSACIARPQFSSTFHARVGASLTSGSNAWSGAGFYALDLESGFARADFTLFSTSSSSVLNIHTLDRYDIGHAYVIDSVNYKCQSKRSSGELVHPLQWVNNASFVGESEFSGMTLENWEYKSGNEYHKVSLKKGTNEPVLFTERIMILNGSESELVLTVREWSTEASPKWARFVPNFCMNENNVGDANAVVYFANNNWNCADVACDSTVPYNSPQPDYACAEFVARCLAYGGFIPNLGATDPQGSYSGYNYNGNSYSLIDTTGLSPCLGALGFTKLPAAYSSVDACVATIGDGGDGYFSHAVIGVAPQVIDAHNWAVNNLAVNYDLPGGVDAAWGCPGTPPPSTGSYYSTQVEASFVDGGAVDKQGENREKIVVEKTGSEIHFIEEKPAQKFF